MKKGTTKAQEEIVEEFYKQFKPARIIHHSETNPALEAFFAQKLEEAKQLMANARRAPKQENS